MPGLALNNWGPGAWNTLHVFAHTAPETLSDVDVGRWETLLITFADYLPCPRCREHFHDFLERRMTPRSLATRGSIVSLLNDAHNEVNARVGKRVYSLKEHYEVYSFHPRWRQRDVCAVRDVVLYLIVGVVVYRVACRRMARGTIQG